MHDGEDKETALTFSSLSVFEDNFDFYMSPPLQLRDVFSDEDCEG